MALTRCRNLATLKRMRTAQKRIDAEIRGNMRDATSHISRGLSREGWWGGYEHAVSDVLLMMQSGVLPNDSRVEHIWQDPEDVCA